MTTTSTPDTTPRRLDIQGLRGLAVVPGFTYHMTGLLPGAVVFIDMFFAVSGYLITSRLIQLAQTRNSRRYYYDFYKFRVKRLFPASITVIVVTTILAWILFVPTRAHGISLDARSALLFFANIRDALQGTDYMHRGQSTTPLLPFWSLSMEEQFYVVWPILVLLVIGWAAGRGRQRRTLAWASTLILIVSFCYGLWFTRAHHVAAYYDTPSRAWDFAVGSLLSVYAMRHQLSHPTPDPARSDSARRRLSTLIARAEAAARGLRDLLNRHPSLVSWTGGLLFFLAVLVTPTDHGFPVPWGFMGVLGAALVIFAGIDRRPKNWLLSNRFSAWLGDLSYSIYLVHFPIMIFAASYLSTNKVTLYGFDIVATIGASLLLYYFVEEPGRRGLVATRAWLRAGRHHPVVRAVLVCVAATAILFAFSPQAPAVWTSAGAPWTPDPAQPQQPVSATTRPLASPAPSPAPSPATPASPGLRRLADPNLVPPTPALQDAIARSLTLTSWPHLSNAGRIDDLAPFLTPCAVTNPLKPPCVARPVAGTDPAKVAVAMGDSTTIAYWPMLENALVSQGWTVVLVANVDCTAPLLPTPPTSQQGCPAFRAAFTKVFDTWRPTLVLMNTDELALPYLGDTTASATAAYESGMRANVMLARTYAARVVLLSPPPAVDAQHTPAACDVRGSSPRNCTYTPASSWFTLNAADRDVARDTGATYADLVPFFCAALVCPGVVDHVVVHADKDHITPEYAAMLAPSFAQWLRRHGL